MKKFLAYGTGVIIVCGILFCWRQFIFALPKMPIGEAIESCLVCGMKVSIEKAKLLQNPDGVFYLRHDLGDVSINRNIDVSSCLDEEVTAWGTIRKLPWQDVPQLVSAELIVRYDINKPKACYYLE